MFKIKEFIELEIKKRKKCCSSGFSRYNLKNNLNFNDFLVILTKYFSIHF